MDVEDWHVVILIAVCLVGIGGTFVGAVLGARRERRRFERRMADIEGHVLCVRIAVGRLARKGPPS